VFVFEFSVVVKWIHPNPIFIVFSIRFHIRIRHYSYPFSIKLFKKLYLFSITNVINFIIKI
jgi:hypothetical protein